MNAGIMALLFEMIQQKYIGKRHTPEKRIMKLISYHINDSRTFKKEYMQLLNKVIIIRMMKRTGKGADWHISINPRELKTVGKILRGEYHG